MTFGRWMLTTALTTAAIVISTSTLQARTPRHLAWDGMVMGKNGSKIRGLVSMEVGDTKGTTAVEISYKGDAAGATRPWHIHRGSCANGGPIFGAASAYATLKANAKGVSEGKATLAVALPDTGYFYVNVHESPSRMGTIVACGDLLLEE